jgi:hypothetical protein
MIQIPPHEIGFTGTRHGMTMKQRFLVEDILHQRFPTAVHLGDCHGADAQAYYICVMLGLRTIGHPPIEAKARALLLYNKELPAKEYKERNKDIVDACELLLAAPHGFTEQFRGSGTWHTIRYARKMKKPYIIIWPDGERFAQF